MSRLTKLVAAAIKTHEVDRDANFYHFLKEADVTYPTIESFLEAYLVWANGPNWEEDLKDFEVNKERS